jgi:hypothetical protein
MNIIEAVKYLNEHPDAIIKNINSEDTFLELSKSRDGEEYYHEVSKEVEEDGESVTTALEFSDFFSVWEIVKH